MEGENSNFSKIYKITCLECNKNMFSDWKNETCTNCNKVLTSEPVEIINPIEKIKPFSIIITKSFGELDPLSYSNNDILHVGISNSKGKVYNFWNNYNIEDESRKIWKRVLNIELDQLPEELKKNPEKFNDILYENFLDQKKKFSNYNQFNNNCYDYVCRFLNKIKYGQITWTKESLAISIIEPKILFFDKFCSLYKQINSSIGSNDKVGEKITIEEDTTKAEYTYSVCDICNEMIIMGQRNRCQICPDYDLCDNCMTKQGHEHKMGKI